MPSHRTIDLIELESVADKGWDDADRSALDIRDDRYFGFGWYRPGKGADGTIERWMGARAGSIDFLLNRTRPLRIRLRLSPPRGAAVPTQRLRTYWNGYDLGVAELGDDVQILELRIPKKFQRVGPNRLELLPKIWVDELRLNSAGRTRNISVALREMEFVRPDGKRETAPGPALRLDAGSIVQRPGSVLSYSFPGLEGEAHLTGKGRFTSGVGPNPGQGLASLQLHLTNETGETETVWQRSNRASAGGPEFIFDIDLSDLGSGYFSVSITLHRRGSENVAADVVWETLEIRTESDPPTAKPDEEQAPNRPNILLVLFDTLRADHTEAYGAQNVSTPNIARLSSEGGTFLEAYAPSSWTRSSVATLLSGTNITYHKTLRETSVLSPDVEYLPEILKRHGYRTACISFNGHLRRKWGFGRGFDTLQELGTERPALLRKYPSPEAYAEHIWEEYLRPATEGSAPYFIYLHELDPHGPYEAPPPYNTMYPAPYRGWAEVVGRDIHLVRAHLTRLEQADYEYLNAQYRGEISFMDAYLGTLLERLEMSGQMENTLVVFLSDHGEEFGEHGGVGHAVTLHNEVLKVPYIWMWKGTIQAGVRIQETVGLIDFTPTVLDFLSIPAPEATQGRSLMRLLEGHDAHAQSPPIFFSLGKDGDRSWRGVQIGDWKLIRHAVFGTPHYELFDLATDPKEFANLWGSEAVIGAALRQVLDRQIQSDEGSSPIAPLYLQEEELNPQEVEQLKNLGYLR